MRVAREAGESWKEIGRRYGCDISTVQRLVREAEHGS
jgi:transposase